MIIKTEWIQSGELGGKFTNGKKLILIFNNESSSPEEIERAGEKYLLTLYKAPTHITSLNKLRHDVFQKTAASNKKQVQLARLPPTIDAAREHLHRVYLQIQL